MFGKSAFIIIALISLSLMFASPALAAGHYKQHKHLKKSADTIIAPASTGSENPIPIAEERALSYWHETPCGGLPITVGFATETSRFRAEETAAYGLTGDYSWSSWWSPTGDDVKTSPTSTYADCVITFNTQDWPTCETSIKPTITHCTYSDSWYAINEKWSQFCQAFIHEWGNLLGISEEGIGGVTVMSQNGPADPLPICQTEN